MLRGIFWRRNSGKQHHCQDIILHQIPHLELFFILRALFKPSFLRKMALESEQHLRALLFRFR
jgi:hypothetical protein